MIEVRYFGLPGLAFTFFSGPIIRRWTAARVARTGFIIAAIGLIISGATLTLAVVLAGSVIFVAGIALCVPAMISFITSLSPANNGLIIAVYSFNMFIGASLGPQLVVGLRSLGFFVTCLVFAAVLVSMSAVIRAAPAKGNSVAANP
jgi:cyanate permease